MPAAAHIYRLKNNQMSNFRMHSKLTLISIKGKERKKNATRIASVCDYRNEFTDLKGTREIS